MAQMPQSSPPLVAQPPSQPTVFLLARTTFFSLDRLR
ncbi:hypothetical protein CCACVL1_29980 [Corchorus capsularis]|uniref:Uncharacterized protein n=1 Tax=Corchorus capsularis TaxID=210143 RepID=A0A1R3FZA0_COCAP|nr:hypothetical protein CCACVL1_29980 [Corchorus capsularis]